MLLLWAHRQLVLWHRALRLWGLPYTSKEPWPVNASSAQWDTFVDAMLQRNPGVSKDSVAAFAAEAAAAGVALLVAGGTMPQNYLGTARTATRWSPPASETWRQCGQLWWTACGSRTTVSPQR